MRPIRCSLTVLLALGALTLGGCGGDSSVAPPEEDVQDYIEAVEASSGAAGIFRSGFAPAGGSGPVINVGGAGAMITGGSSFRTVSSAQAFNRIIVAIDGVYGYYEINLPTSVTAEELILTLVRTLPVAQFNVEFALANAGGVGNWGSELVQALIVGTGIVQVSVTWNTAADVDLYVIEPTAAGEEIYYGDKQSALGGFLDLDSNAGCSGNDYRNENITWPESPPNGTYQVKVNLWSECGTTTTDYVVTVRRQNRAPLTFTGVLNAPGVGGDAGAGTLVTTFAFP